MPIALAAAVAAIAGCTAQPAARTAAGPAPNQRSVADLDRPAPTTQAPAPTIPRGPDPTTPPSTDPTPAGPGTCRAAQLQLRFQFDDSGMGRHWFTYAFRNRSASACAMSGVPSVRLLDAAGDDLLPGVPPDGGSGGAGATEKVLLRPGASAFFSIGERIAPADGGSCAASTTLAVVPPGQRDALTVPAVIKVCDGRVWLSHVRTTA
jgi:hypothetical protein